MEKKKKTLDYLCVLRYWLYQCDLPILIVQSWYNNVSQIVSVFQDLGPGCPGLPQKHVEAAYEGQWNAGYRSSKLGLYVSRNK